MTLNPTVVTFAGDWHADPTAAVSGVRQASQAGAQVLMHVGDILFTGERFRVMANALEAAAMQYGVTVVFIRGANDDPNLLDDLGPAAEAPFRHLRDHVLYAPNGATWRWSGLLFGAFGGAASVDYRSRNEGIDWWEDERATEDEFRMLAGGPRLDILVSHDAPITEALRRKFHTAPAGWDLNYAEAHSRMVERLIWATRPKLQVAGRYHVRLSDHIMTMGATTRLEILNRGDGYDGSVPPANLLTVDLLNATCYT